MSKITYDDFIREQTHTIKKWLDLFDISEKKWKTYNDFLIKFLQWSSLTVTNQCKFDDKKKNEVLIDILSDIPIIDPDMFDKLVKRRQENIVTKPLWWSKHDYECRTDEIKNKIKKPIRDFVIERTNSYFNFYSLYSEQKINTILWKLRNLDKLIEEYEIQISTNETWNIEYEDMLSPEEIAELKIWLWELEEERDIFNINLSDYEERYQSRVNNYQLKVNIFQKKLQRITEKYIFAHTNPLWRLKKSYIELFLLDKMDIWFFQWPEYSFSLWDKTLSLIEDKKLSLIDMMKIEKIPKQWELNFDE